MAEEKRANAIEEEENIKVTGDELSEERLGEASGRGAISGKLDPSLVEGSIQKTELDGANLDDGDFVDPKNAPTVQTVGTCFA